MIRSFFIFTTLLLALKVWGQEEDDVNANARPGGKKPNIILFLTDDQDLHMNSLDYQAVVQKEFVQKGTWFKKHFCTVALCCPSRVSLLTGKHAHNTNITAVKPPYGGYTRFVEQGLNENYLPIWLQEAGYSTYYTGKLMNGHSLDTYNKPTAGGWTRSDFLLDPNTYIFYNASMTLDNTTPKFHPGKYSTDLLANRSVEFLNEAINAKKPFFLGIAPIAPHSETVQIQGKPSVFMEPVPAERHRHLFPDAKVPRTPNFNPDTPGAAAFMATMPKLTDEQVKFNDAYYRLRLQSLQSVDEMVQAVITKLEANPEVLANTYLFYTTDNGFHIGQHRLPPGKSCSIEEDVNIPFLARGPGIAAGAVAQFPTSHTDIAPTIMQLAGVKQRRDFDGLPIPLTEKAQNSPRLRKAEHVNVEFWGTTGAEGTMFAKFNDNPPIVTSKSLRVVGEDYDFSYVVWCTNEHELYDMKVDPFQMKNLMNSTVTSGMSIPQLKTRLDTLLLTLKACKGKVCYRPWETVFPSGKVKTLGDAMNPKYDSFFTSQEKVTFSACATGYIQAVEGALKPKPYTGQQRFKAL